MYVGSIRKPVKLYRRIYRSGIGDLPFVAHANQTLEVYRCDHCGRQYEVLGLAEEPFYCEVCGKLVSIRQASPAA